MSSNSVKAVFDVFDFPQASPKLEGLIFTKNFFIYFWQGGKSGQGVPLNGSNLEKWIEPGFLMACVAGNSYRENVQTEILALQGSPSPLHLIVRNQCFQKNK